MVDSALRIPADLALLLSRQALCDYSLACEAAQAAAEGSGAATSPTPAATAHLRDCRTKVKASEEALRVIGDDVATRSACDASLDRHRLLIAGLVGTTLDRLCGELEASEEEILAAADRIQRLRALLEQLDPPERQVADRRWPGDRQLPACAWA